MWFLAKPESFGALGFQRRQHGLGCRHLELAGLLDENLLDDAVFDDHRKALVKHVLNSAQIQLGMLSLDLGEVGHLVSSSSALNSRSSKLRTLGVTTLAATFRARQALKAGSRHQPGDQPSKLPRPDLPACERSPACRGCPDAIRGYGTANARCSVTGHRTSVCSSCSSNWSTPADNGTSVEPKTHRGNVRSPDTSG